ncbi:class I SAM-dependent methyltransferase [Tenacibaculum maritimum]|uniref:class I SAM-dependent methyltransferase n=2 Tax=Tenacibaculum maritimum TaxID=107401 RepID=UPI0012E684F1|nr:class I SAM-dependent methyltransferase [Tenacibaculum maritimum]MCD9580787.1 class I SAM-dependent methyltransferase [Tenacibaculum maritimum]MCD9635061.1 class I SAM-dependent methyltransferase [Tenacibaculum maritimum]CAA0251377.1 Probable SAM-dependent methyltransferase [Tenacibaculum maritimum]CAA0257874.1 Probable SAM-dependent methyltransferase [Tenacibaculum maritimum]
MGEEKELYKNVHPYLNCIDYTVSNESYEVMLNKEFQMLVTSPVPSNLEDYYKSDNYISHTDSKKSLLDRMYHIVKGYALKKKLNLINSFASEEKKVLDIGAGTGDFLNICKKNNWKVFGVEPSVNARKNAYSKGIHLKNNLSSYKDEQFDIITMWHVLEHVQNLPEYIQTLKKLLKPTGRLIIAVPNYKSYDAKYYHEFWAAFDVPRHLWHFSKYSIQQLFSKVNIEIEKILPMIFDAYYVSILSEKNKTGKINFIRAFYIGFLSNLKAKKSLEHSSLIYVLKNKEKSF